MKNDTLSILRITETAHGTFGVLLFGPDPALVTLELPWRNNAVGTSCIPVGDYVAIPIQSQKYGWALWIQNVPGRTEILFHAGNQIASSRGCVLVGQTFGRDRIVQSRLGMESLRKWVGARSSVDVSVRNLTHKP